MDRMNVAYRAPSLKGEIQICSMNEFKKKSSFENITVFNNLVATKEELEKNWEVPIEKSWHRQFVV